MNTEEIKLFGNAEDTLRFNYKCEECDKCSPVPKAKECGGKGALTCGGCSCEPGWKGNQYKFSIIKFIYMKTLVTVTTFLSVRSR